jgi:small-conductance mechanosensitive channel
MALPYNILSCQGGPAWATGIMGGCSISWLILGALFILIMILRRQTEDGILQGVPYNVFGAGVAGLGAAIVLTTIFGQPRWELLAGLAGIGIGGFGLGFIGIGGDGE